MPAVTTISLTAPALVEITRTGDFLDEIAVFGYGQSYERLKVGRFGMRLSPRELEVARLAVDGHTCREIAARLFISKNTVKTHLVHIYSKLGVRKRPQMEHELPPPPHS